MSSALSSGSGFFLSFNRMNERQINKDKWFCNLKSCVCVPAKTTIALLTIQPKRPLFSNRAKDSVLCGGGKRLFNYSFWVTKSRRERKRVFVEYTTICLCYTYILNFKPTYIFRDGRRVCSWLFSRTWSFWSQSEYLIVFLASGLLYFVEQHRF